MSLKITNHDVRIYDLGGGARLTPGANTTITPEQWKTYSEGPVGKALLASKVLTVESATSAAPEDEGIEALTTAEAVKLVGETLNPVELKEWEKTEKRPAVQKAIAAQLAKITPVAPSK